MNKNHELTNSEELLDRIDATAKQKKRVSLKIIFKAVGQRSFGPLLLLAGLVMLAPIVGDIPGVPTTMGVLVVLVAGQLLFRREYIWLPGWLLKRSVEQGKLRKTIRWLRPVARFLDRWSRPRLTRLVQNAGVSVIAIACIGIAAATPVMEVVLFSANVAGAAIAAFGLSLIAHDGLLVLVALAFTAATSGVLMYGLM